ncbi:MAG: hypothetical protein E7181_00045 [Erysipelotrichaceae bacterium]|nr:hypothetical protein [Erysipelotrichaceae bacterium]
MYLGICITFIVCGALTLVVYLLEKVKRYSVRAVLIKTVVSSFFLSLAIFCSYVNQGHAINTFVTFGLILGLLGDIWLDLKYVYPKDDKVYTYAGFLCFGVGHIMFVIGMLLQYFRDAHFLYILIPIVGALIASLINLFLEKPMKLNFGEMRLTVCIYAFCLFMTPFTALSLAILTGWSKPTLVMIFVGGILFAISDLVLSGTYFGEGKERPIDLILNYLTYYGAQFVIAFSLFFF